MQTTKRPLWIGVLAAPLTAPVLQMFLQIIDAYAAHGFRELYYPQMELALPYLFGIPMGYATMLFFGVPYIWVLRRCGWISWMSIVGGSVVAGATVWSMFFSAFGLIKRSLPELVVHGGVLGLACGIAFCLVVGLGTKKSIQDKAPNERSVA